MGINLGSTAISDLKVGETQVDKVYLGEEVVWQKAAPIVNALKFELTDPLDTTATLTLTKTGNPPGQNYEYSTDGSTWTSVALGSPLNYSNGVLYIRGMNTSGVSANLSSNYITFVSNGSSSVSCVGNVMYLLDYTQELTTLPQNSGLKNLFLNNIKLITAPTLPATTLTRSCYVGMFRGCTSLISAPSLPATTLPINCYESMFRDCTALTHIPQLPATVLDSQPYFYMFAGCSSLYVSDSQTELAVYQWNIPTNGVFTTDSTSSYTFNSCLGTRASNNFSAITGQSVTYYTQNPPVEAS